jgi:hypothetical protein
MAHVACKILRTMYKDPRYYERSHREIGQGSKTKNIWVLVSPRKHVRLDLIGSVVESGVIFGVKRPICFRPTPKSQGNLSLTPTAEPRAGLPISSGTANHFESSFG